MFIEFDRPKKARGQQYATSSGRLVVGYRLKDWSKVWYEPITSSNDALEETTDLEAEPELGLFSCGHGDPTADEPTEGEVVWLPHYDFARMPSTSLKGKKLLQRRFLHNAWRYCAAKNPEVVLALNQEFTLQPKYHGWPQWAGWYDMARQWKKNDKKQRTRRGRRRGERESTARAAGLDAEDVDINSDSSTDDDDSGVGIDDDRSMSSMPPPLIPSRRNGTSGSNGKRRANEGRGTGLTPKRSRVGTNRNGASGRRRHVSSPLMSGGAGIRSVSRSESIYGDVDEHDDDDSSRPWDSHHPTPVPELPARPSIPTGPGGAGGAGAFEAFGLNAFPTPTATQSLRGGSRRPDSALGRRLTGPSSAPPDSSGLLGAPNEPSGQAETDRLRPFSKWAKGACARVDEEDEMGENIHVGRKVGGFEERNPDPDEIEEDYLRRASEINGDMTEQEALRRAREASAALHRESSRQPSAERRLPNGVRPSIEGDDDDNDDGN